MNADAAQKQGQQGGGEFGFLGIRLWLRLALRSDQWRADVAPLGCVAAKAGDVSGVNRLGAGFAEVVGHGDVGGAISE